MAERRTWRGVGSAAWALAALVLATAACDEDNPFRSVSDEVSTGTSPPSRRRYRDSERRPPSFRTVAQNRVHSDGAPPTSRSHT